MVYVVPKSAHPAAVQEWPFAFELCVYPVFVERYDLLDTHEIDEIARSHMSCASRSDYVVPEICTIPDSGLTSSESTDAMERIRRKAVIVSYDITV